LAWAAGPFPPRRHIRPEEAGQLVASDCIAQVEVGAKVIVVAYRNDLGERDPFAPFRVGCRSGIDADIARDERRIERTDLVLQLQAPMMSG